MFPHITTIDSLGGSLAGLFGLLILEPFDLLFFKHMRCTYNTSGFRGVAILFEVIVVR
jgi:hypothetical protein